MPTFKYEGRDVSGNLVAGERSVDSAESLSGQLSNEGITPITITLQQEQRSVLQQIKILFEKIS